MASPSLPSSLARGVAAGLVGTTAMTAFQRLVEQPVTRRPDSFVPAEIAEALGVRARTAQGRTRLNWVSHFGFGSVWGAAYGVAAGAGLAGQRAVHTVFAVLYPVDVLAATALGVYAPRTWSRQDWVVDVVDKYVALQATGLAYDRALAPRD